MRYFQISILLTLGICFTTIGIGQELIFKDQVALDWKLEENYLRYNDTKPTLIWTCSETDFNGKHPKLPIYNARVALPANGDIDVVITQNESSRIESLEVESEYVKNDLVIDKGVFQSRDKYFGYFSFLPFIQQNGQLNRIDNFTVEVFYKGKLIQQRKTAPPTFTSVLSSGDVFKISVAESGVYKITKNQLAEIGIDPASVDIRNLHIYGNGGAKLNEMLSENRIDDLAENPIFIKGEEDGSLDDADAIYFYGEGPDVWQSSETGTKYIENPYANFNYYYLKVDGNRGLRIQEISRPTTIDLTSTIYDDYQRYESDRINLMGDFALTEGTGQEWYGEYFNSIREQSFQDKFDFENLVLTETVQIKSRIAVRSKSSSSLELNFGGTQFTRSVGRVSGDADRPYALNSSFTETLVLSSNTPNLDITYPSNGDISEAWLDYIEIRAKKEFNWNRPSFYFRSLSSKDVNSFEFSTTVPNDVTIWNVSNPVNVSKMQTSGGIAFQSMGIEQSFFAWKESATKTVVAEGQVENQNLHGITDVDMLVVYYKDFKPAVDNFVAHRSAESGLNIQAIDIDLITEEFGSGKKDPSALRNFLKMIYDRTNNFKYLLIVGDASYDYRNLDDQLEDQNFVPVYETIPSLDPIDNFPTDDYYGLLSDDEGGNLKGGLDLALGRLPVKSLEEANDVINKIISYDGEKFGDWRIRQGWAADDEDSSSHFAQSDDIQTDVSKKFPFMNHRMTYFDAFKQESTPGGERFPEATNSINENIFNGMLVFNYLGHGGPRGWAQERVLQIADIQKWDNPDKLPLLVTATCTFTGFDDPALVSGGEECILKDDGGVIALMTTVRPVFSSDNKTLVTAVFDTLLSKVNQEQPRFGDVMVKAKNTLSGSIEENARKFVLIGDPSQKLAIPLNNISITKINGKDANATNQDTIGALEEVEISGEILDQNGQLLNDFNGVVFPTIFDKQTNLRLLENDPGSRPGDFDVYSNIIFKGSATVSNGVFDFKFVVPSDINYSIGKGRISVYAHNGQEDAAGFNNNIIFGGGDGNGLSDDDGPEIDLFMNDESFAFGGITDDKPILLAKLSDDIGINVSGSSIGHDLTAILDENTQQTFILNDFYEADQDSYQSGTVRFPLKDIAPGKHTLRVKAWDTSNNSNEAIIEFVVVDKNNTNLEHVFNYPNPFTDQTAFQFEHDLEGSSLDVLVNIYTISGKLIKSIQESRLATGYRVDDVIWDGKDDFGSRIGKGVYLYKIKVNANELNESRESDFGKLVILK